MSAPEFTMTINGVGVEGDALIDVNNPANGELVGQVPDCSSAQLDMAIAAARAAFPHWSSRTPDERRAVAQSLSDRILEHRDALAALLMREQGKPIAQADAEILSAAMYLQALSTIELPVTTKDTGHGRIFESHRVPIGVVCGIAPWNFPVGLAMYKIAPALLTGNTLVLKPSPYTPLTTLRIAELARDILPAGVLNVISGGDDLGPRMTSHPGFDKISFTGSTQTGRRVLGSAAETLKRVTLELGGNDAAIVLPDVDIPSVVEPLFWSAFRNAGQICVATKRLYIHADIYDALKDALITYAKTVKVGDGALADSQIGPVNNRTQYERVLDLLRDSEAHGHHFLIGGDRIEGEGYFLPVTIVDNPPETSRIVQEEQFGPVLPLLKYDDVEDVIARANASEFGLGGSVWSGDEARAIAIARRLNTGNVWINNTQLLSPVVAFGGHKQSGLGVEGGLEGLLEYTVPQTIIRNA